MYLFFYFYPFDFVANTENSVPQAGRVPKTVTSIIGPSGQKKFLEKYLQKNKNIKEKSIDYENVNGFSISM